MTKKRRRCPENEGASARPTKQQMKQVHHHIEQLKLADEQERRLGKLSSTSQWLIRICQKSGSNACLVIREILKSTVTTSEWNLKVETADRQMLHFVFKGKWVLEASQHFKHDDVLIADHPFLISGAGACLDSATDKVAFPQNRAIMQILDLSDLDLHENVWLPNGWLEVMNGSITCSPGTPDSPIKERIREKAKQPWTDMSGQASDGDEDVVLIEHRSTEVKPRSVAGSRSRDSSNTTVDLNEPISSHGHGRRDSSLGGEQRTDPSGLPPSARPFESSVQRHAMTPTPVSRRMGQEDTPDWLWTPTPRTPAPQSRQPSIVADRSSDLGNPIAEPGSTWYGGHILTEIGNVEPWKNCNADVEIVEIWGSTLYVTDFTRNAQVHSAADDRLIKYLRSEMPDLSLPTDGTSRGGYVFQVGLWDSQALAIRYLRVGMQVRLENFYSKIGRAGFLEGNMGDKNYTNSQGKLRLIPLNDEEARFIKAKHFNFVNGTQMGQDYPEGDNAELLVRMATEPTRVEVSTAHSIHSTRGVPLPPGSMLLRETQTRVKQEDGHETEQRLEKRRAPSALPSPIEIDGDIRSLSVEHLYDVAHFDKGRGNSRTFRCKVKVAKGGVRPLRIRDWVSVFCKTCEKFLPNEHAICVACSEMDSKDLEYVFRVVFNCQDVSNEEPTLKDSRSLVNGVYPVAIGGPSAAQFFHHFHPRDVREREKTQIKLARRLAPVLGAQAAYDLIQPANLATCLDSQTNNVMTFAEFVEPIPHAHRQQRDIGIGVTPVENVPQPGRSASSRNTVSIAACRLLRLEEDERGH